MDGGICNPQSGSSNCGKKLQDEMFFRFSLPEKLHSYQGRQFEGEVVTLLCRLLKIEKTYSTPYHPQSDSHREIQQNPSEYIC